MSLVQLFELDDEELRVITPDVGGGFGAKYLIYPEEVVVPLAARLLGRPVKWIEDRREHFLTSIQERDQYWDLEIAFDCQGARSSACAGRSQRPGRLHAAGRERLLQLRDRLAGPYTRAEL